MSWLNTSCHQASSNNHSVSFPKKNEDSLRSGEIYKKINGPEKHRRLDSFFQYKATHQAFNGAILVAQWGQILYKNVNGWADYQNQVPITEHTVFQLASTSKPFTAAAIMQLKEKGMLSYEDEVQKYFPDFPYHGVTIRLLLSHRSGMPNYLNFAPLYWKMKGELMSNTDLMEMMAAHKPPMASHPDSHFEYCNTNFAVLAAIVEKISGMSFSQYMDQNVFKPLGMTDAWIYSPENFNRCNDKACGYSRIGWQKGGFDFTDGVTGDKGLYASISDMWKWDCALSEYKLLKKETLEEAYMPQSFEKRGMKNYGFGWRMIVYSPTVKAVFHNGWWHQFNNAYFRGLNDRTTIIVLGSNSNFANYQIQPILDIVSGSKSTTSESVEDETEK